MEKQYILYGAGELGKLASQFFNFYNIVYTVCDDNPENYSDGYYWENNNDICRLEDIRGKEDYTVLVCISTTSYNVIKDKLIGKGFTNVKPFFQVAEEINKANKYRHPLTNGWKHSYPFHNKNIQIIAKSFYPDLKSWHSYYQFFAWHKNYEEFYPRINCNDRYFIPEVTGILHDHEIFVDTGAYDGRVTKKFIEIVKGKHDEIYMFEPQINHCIALGEQIEGLPYIHLYNTCLGNKNGWSYFNHQHNYLCKIDKKSKQTSAIRKLDYISKLDNIKPTFIKYHLEGYELEAIKGSIKTIKKYRPIIAVTTYHTEEGLYKLPLYLIKNLKDYNFYWRNHNYQGQGAIMYCIPKERNK